MFDIQTKYLNTTPLFEGPMPSSPTLFTKIFGIYIMRCAWTFRHALYNWVYTTNHKRISVNYFWFVLFAGVVGMVLATVIRLELAYPGVGILAGDNSQYLSIVTAHGVIMVFFMAIPLLFGFLGNFLLPTQLGVHDVAFPRMNSAAFWFLPASLLALCQLVCIDRRYQRMNCFNIKELQSLLRNKFFFELTSDNKFLTDRISKSSSLRYKLNSITDFNLNDPTSFQLFNEFFISNKSNFFNSSFNSITSNIQTTQDKLISYILNPSKTTNYLGFNMFYIQMLFFFNSLKNLLFTIFTFIYYTLNLKYLLLSIWNFIKFNFMLNITFFKFPFSIFSNFLSLNFFYLYFYNFTSAANSSINVQRSNFSTNYTNSFDFKKVNFENNFINQFTVAKHPELIYKIKIGNYLPDDLYKTNYRYLYTSLNAKSILGHKASWFQSEDVSSLIKNDLLSFNYYWFNNYFNFETQVPFDLNKFNGFYFYSVINIFNNYNQIFLSKFYFNPILLNNYVLHQFFTQSKQSRVLNNWRSLKLNREGWRCRMLAARHQRSLYRRYVNENELIWVVEKNAKDLLPGWAMVTPFSSRTRYTLIGKTDIGVAIVAVTLIASMVSSANFLMTYRYLSTLNNRKMRDARSFFTESVIAASWMMIAANPMLILGLFMLLSDRHWKTCFFDYSGGGDTILFQHMFWFFGHPEVYIIIFPCFGITNTLLSFYLRKRISARASLLYSLYTIAFLGFFVWGHHMYMVGLSHTTRMLYSTLTVMISVPAATKIMHWLVTFVNSAMHFELPFILVLLFIFYFVSGGISGMAVAHTGMDVLFHDTFYVIGHFHVMLAGSLMFAGFAAFYFYLPSIFGVRYSRYFAYLHIFYYSIGQIFTVIPMIWLGYAGMPRRVLDYPAAMGGWHSLISSAHIITVAGILAFVLMLFDSLRKQKSYIIKTFGVGRYNTRLNFYLYQAARNRYWLGKHLNLLSVRPVWHSYNNQGLVYNFEHYETTLFYYTFTKYNKFSEKWSYLK